MIDQTKITPSTRLTLGACLILATATACNPSGGKASTVGTFVSGASTLDVDFGLRRDLELSLGTAFLGDVIHNDLNGDGIADLIETDFLRQKLNIALGRADGTFDTIVERGTMGKSFRLALGDFDGDGRTDVAVANRERQGVGAQTVEVFLQGAALDFSGSTLSFSAGSDPTDLAVSFNSDTGVDEIYAAFPVDRMVRVLSASNGTSLVEVGSLDSGNLGAAGQPFSVAFVDRFANGLEDLVVGEMRIPGAADRVVIHPRISTDGGAKRIGSTFGPAEMVLSPVFKPVVDNVHDADGNGFDDIAVAQLGDDTIYLIPSDAAGFQAPASIDFGGRTTSAIFPDLDGDGFAEAVATTLNQASIQVRPGTGPMTWGESVHYSVGPIPRAIDTIQLPGDTIQDILCANASDLTVMVGLGDGSFRCARGYDTDLDRPGHVVLADFNGNGVLDYVAVSGTQRSITFHEGAGDGTFSLGSELPMAPMATDTPGGLAVADVDGDGRLDVLASITSMNEVRLYRNGGSASGFADAPAADITGVGSSPASLAVADFNGDTLPDFVVANRGDQTIQLFLNDGAGNFTAQVPVATQLFTPGSLRCGDLDADGSMDLVVTGTTAGGFEVRFFQGDATNASLSFRSLLPIDDKVNSLELADFNSDGMLDVVLGQSTHSSSDIFLMLNQDDGALGFQSLRIAMGTIGPANVMVGDLDLDSNLDILVATSAGELRMILGDGLGSFGAPTPERGELPSIENCFSASLVDVNGDDLPDVITVSRETPFMWVGLNTSVESSVVQ